MSSTVIKVENLSKQYRLGEVGTGTISHDLNRWWARVRGKEDPFSKIGEINDRTKKGNSDYVWALRDINFEVKQGEVLGIIGRNGAGKSTLLKLLSKVTSPTTGSIKMKGRVASLLEVGTGFHPELTGRENIFLNGAILGMTKAEIKNKFDEIVDFASVERYIDTPVKRYSSGMYVRLAFAVAAHLEPEILIVDEVLAVGDVEFQKKCIGKMSDVAEHGRTILFVSHNMRAVKNLCGSGLYFVNGKTEAYGEIHEIVNQYISESNLNGSDSSIFPDLNRIDFDQQYYKIEYLSLYQNDRPIESSMRNGDPMTIEMGLLLFENCTAFRVTMDVCTEDDEVILRSLLDEDYLRGMEIKKGKYALKVTVPPNLLIAGRKYFLRFQFSIVGFKILKPENGLRIPIEVEETGSFNRIQFTDPYKGVLTLNNIDWEVDKLR